MTLLVVHMTRKTVSEMTYNVSSGTLNLLYHRNTNCDVILLKLRRPEIDILFFARVGLGSSRIDPVHFLAGCRKWLSMLNLLLFTFYIAILSVRLSIRPSRSGILWKRLNILS